jgi:hypothetical protein
MMQVTPVTTQTAAWHRTCTSGLHVVPIYVCHRRRRQSRDSHSMKSRQRLHVAHMEYLATSTEDCLASGCDIGAVSVLRSTAVELVKSAPEHGGPQ